MFSPLNHFLATGQQPLTSRDKAALLDEMRSKLLTNQQTNKPTNMQPTTIPKTLTAEFLQWKKSNPSGTAQQFTAWKIAGGKPVAPADNLPRTATGRIDSLELTRRYLDQREAEKKAASAAVGVKQCYKTNFPKP